ncbi:hypothetical protein Hokovirus_2_7 [Hokovirus HKV1]|uniref:Uncharacterized protein n=1 Tax=Hokovirus HKV1 TaxID=1977638 RepID=A0A1V0SFI5_9VIRU|nr:hypothetical protein Hokovirus_2_7 [Hokovirus HKV1]
MDSIVLELELYNDILYFGDLKFNNIDQIPDNYVLVNIVCNPNKINCPEPINDPFFNHEKTKPEFMHNDQKTDFLQKYHYYKCDNSNALKSSLYVKISEISCFDSSYDYFIINKMSNVNIIRLDIRQIFLPDIFFTSQHMVVTKCGVDYCLYPNNICEILVDYLPCIFIFLVSIDLVLLDDLKNYYHILQIDRHGKILYIKQKGSLTKAAKNNS